MAPVVAEVVDVEEPLDASADEGSQADPRRVVDLALEELVVRKGLAVDAIVDHELEQMRIGQPTVTWMMSCRASKVQVSGTSTRRQSVGSISRSSILTHAIGSIMNGRSVSRTFVTGFSG